MSSDSTTQFAGLEPTYSAREAAALLGRSYSWLDQRLRYGEFVRPDGTQIQPLRAANGYRYFNIEMLKDIAAYCYGRRWYSFSELKLVFRELATDAHCGTGDDEIAGWGLMPASWLRSLRDLTATHCHDDVTSRGKHLGNSGG